MYPLYILENLDRTHQLFNEFKSLAVSYKYDQKEYSLCLKL